MGLNVRQTPLFIARHALRFVLLMLAVSFVCFALVSASPIDPLQANIGQNALLGMSDERRAQLASYWGADASLAQRYVSWLAGVLHGDWGTSLRFNAPAVQVIANRAANSLAMMALAWVVSGVLGFGLGVLAAAKRGSWVDRIVKGYCYLIAATPAFWIGLLMLMVFSVGLHWFPMGFSVPIGVSAADATIFDSLQCMVLPALTLSLTGVANIALHTREKAIDVIEGDCMRFARSRGLSLGAALRHHGLRNLMLPALTLQCASISEIFGGSVLVEQIFSYPGLGQAAVAAGLGADAPLLVGIALVSAAFVFAGNLAANIAYGLVDPRIREGQARD